MMAKFKKTFTSAVFTQDNSADSTVESVPFQTVNAFISQLLIILVFPDSAYLGFPLTLSLKFVKVKLWFELNPVPLILTSDADEVNPQNLLFRGLKCLNRLSYLTF